MRRKYLEEQLEASILLDRDRGVVEVRKDGEVRQEIDFSSATEYKNNKEKVELIYNRFLRIEITGNRILMETDVVLGGASGIPYIDAPENTVKIEVIYRDGSFYLQIA